MPDRPLSDYDNVTSDSFYWKPSPSMRAASVSSISIGDWRTPVAHMFLPASFAGIQARFTAAEPGAADA
ncbi:MAG: hypothetical protein VW547_04240 [Alphaproteobacteria bacterium]